MSDEQLSEDAINEVFESLGLQTEDERISKSYAALTESSQEPSICLSTRLLSSNC